jgi:hypothetical protein
MWYNHYIEVQEAPTYNSSYFDSAIPGVAETLSKISVTPGIPATLITLYLCGRNPVTNFCHTRYTSHSHHAIPGVAETLLLNPRTFSHGAIIVT